MLIRLSSLFIALLLTVNCFAQRQNIKNYTTKDGLAGQIVNSAFQDKDGYLWFATQSGISIFTGNTFHKFEPSESIVGIDAIAINEDKSGNIWIASATGLFIYDFNRIRHYHVDNGLPSNIVRGITFDQNDTPWILTSEGVVQYNKGKFKSVLDPKGYLKSGVLSMKQMSDGTIWFGTQGNGLIRLKNSEYTYYSADDGVLDSYIFSLNAHGDSLLIGTTNQGLVVHYNNKFSKPKIPEIENAWISNIVVRNDEMDIISSSGLVRYSYKGNYSLITEKNGLPSNDLFFGYEDIENNLWLCSGLGLSCFRSEEILSYDKSMGLTDAKITSINRLSDGRIILGTYSYGLNIISLSGEEVEKIVIPEVNDIKITSILELPGKNELWIGSEQSDAGIVILEKKNNKYVYKRSIRTIKGVSWQTVTKLEKDSKDRIWISTFNAGLLCINGQDSLVYSKNNYLPSNEVYTFCIGKDNTLLVSINQKGIFKWTGKGFESINQKYGIKDKTTLCMGMDDNGNIYLGNKTGGLNIIHNDKLYSFTTESGLLSNQIQSLLVNQNVIWIGTDRGLNRITFNQNFKIIALESHSERSGLINAEIQQNSMLLTDSHIWIGSSSGLSRLKRNSSFNKSSKPIIEINNIQLFFEDVKWKNRKLPTTKFGIPKKLVLKHTENHLTFHFNAITSSDVQYSYILEGLESNWTPYSDKTEVTYSNLSNGSYVFKVVAKNNKGIISEVLSLPVFISAPFWQTWWFRILAVLLVGFMIIAFVRYRERQLRSRASHLETVVSERTQELLQATDRAELQRQLVEQKNKEIVDSISYAKRIQSAILPKIQDLKDAFTDLHVFYQPKDIVAGDFYWFEHVDSLKMIAAADCTGHGVPGAIVSVVCYNALNRAVREFGITDPGKILDKTREIILEELSKNDQTIKDGMDISLAVWDETTHTMHWSGANNPLWILRENDLLEIRGDKQPIGMYVSTNPFTTHSVKLEPSDVIVLFTDGYADQFGGKNGKKFKTAKFKALLSENRDLPIDTFGQKIELAFHEWKQNEEQLDDVCVILFRI